MSDESVNRTQQILGEIQGIRQEIPALELAEDKYVFFILGVAAAAIAYGMQRTSSSSLHSFDVVLGLAYVFWGFSFWAGCRNRDRRLKAATDHVLLSLAKLAIEMQQSIIPPSVLHEYADAAAQAIKDGEAERSQAVVDAQYWFHLQFGLLIAGALCFFVWHIIGMSLR
jgi:hypothetical protein